MDGVRSKLAQTKYLKVSRADNVMHQVTVRWTEKHLALPSHRCQHQRTKKAGMRKMQTKATSGICSPLERTTGTAIHRVETTRKFSPS